MVLFSQQINKFSNTLISIFFFLLKQYIFLLTCKFHHSLPVSDTIPRGSGEPIGGGGWEETKGDISPHDTYLFLYSIAVHYIFLFNLYVFCSDYFCKMHIDEKLTFMHFGEFEPLNLPFTTSRNSNKK